MWWHRFDSRPSPNSSPVGQLKERPSPPLTVFNLPASTQVKEHLNSGMNWQDQNQWKATESLISKLFAAVDQRASGRRTIISKTPIWRIQVGGRDFSPERSNFDIPSSPHLTNSQSVIPNPPPPQSLSLSQSQTQTPRPIKRSGQVLPGEEDLFAEELIPSGSRRNTRKTGGGKKKNSKKNNKKNKRKNNVSSRRSESGDEKKEKKSAKQKKKELEEKEEEAARSSREQMQVHLMRKHKR